MRSKLPDLMFGSADPSLNPTNADTSGQTENVRVSSALREQSRRSTRDFQRAQRVDEAAEVAIVAPVHHRQAPILKILSALREAIMARSSAESCADSMKATAGAVG